MWGATAKTSLRLENVLFTCGNSIPQKQARDLVLAKATQKNDNKNTNSVTYGRDWYSQTREAMNSRSPAKEHRRGREREDLYTDNWDGDVYKGNKVNILSVLIVVSILAPVAGLIFALQTYGTLWG